MYNTVSLLDIIFGGIQVIFLFVAIYAIIVANRSVEIAKNATMAQTITTLSLHYSDQVSDALRSIFKWMKKHGLRDNERILKEKKDIIDEFNKLKDSDQEKVELEKNMSIVGHYYHSIYVLWNTGVIKEEFVKQLVAKSQVDTFLGEIRILFEARYEKYGQETFKKFEKLYPN